MNSTTRNLALGAITAVSLALAAYAPTAVDPQKPQATGATISTDATEPVTNNPWVFSMTNPGVTGLQIRGIQGANTQILEIKDYLDAPIFACNLAGGCAMYGDDFKVFSGGEVFNPSLTLHQDGAIQLGNNGPRLYGAIGTPLTCPYSKMWYISDNGRMYYCSTAGGKPIRKL